MSNTDSFGKPNKRVTLEKSLPFAAGGAAFGLAYAFAPGSAILAGIVGGAAGFLGSIIISEMNSSGFPHNSALASSDSSGSGLSVNSNGTFSTDFGGLSLRSDGVVGFKSGGTSFHSDGSVGFDLGGGLSLNSKGGISFGL
jgi:hypothetical protein